MMGSLSTHRRLPPPAYKGRGRGYTGRRRDIPREKSPPMASGNCQPEDREWRLYTYIYIYNNRTNRSTELKKKDKKNQKIFVKITVVLLIGIGNFALRGSFSRSFLEIVYARNINHRSTVDLIIICHALLSVIYRRINLPVDKRVGRTVLNYDL